MKKLILTLSLSLGAIMAVDAQVNPHAIGVRADGGNLGSGAEFSYQHGLGEANRLELDLGGSADLFGLYQSVYLRLTGSYHWVFNITSGFNWFIGPAVQVGTYHSNYSGQPRIYPTAAAGAQGGVEFDFNVFNVPLLVGVDARPMIGLVGGTGLQGQFGGSASVRYTF